MALILNTGLDYQVTWTSICNLAIARLGAKTLNDLHDGSGNSALCLRFLPVAIEYILSQYDFNFARKRTRLAPVTDPPLFGWEYCFHLPTDFVRIVAVYGPEGVSRLAWEGERPTLSGPREWTGTIPWKLERQFLLANEPEVYLLYSALPDLPIYLPAHFVQAVASRLAYMLAPVLTSNDQMIALTAQEAAAQIEEAKKADRAQEYAPANAGMGFYTEAR